MSRWLFNISKEGDSTTSLSHPPRKKKKKAFPDVQTEPPMFQLVCIVSCPVAVHHWEEPGSAFFKPFLQIFVHIGNITPEPTRLHAKQPQLCQLFLVGSMLQALYATASGHSLDSHMALSQSLI